MRPGLWQVLIVVAIIVFLFGAKKIPEFARSFGKAKGEFKKGLKEGEAAFKEAAEAAEKGEEAPAKELA